MDARGRRAAGSAPGSGSRMSLAVLIAMAVIAIALSALIVSPFVPGLVWALSLAVLAWPMHLAVERHVRRPAIAAGLSTAIVAVTLLVPGLVLAWYVGDQITEGIAKAQQFVASSEFDDLVQRYPPVARIYGVVNDANGSDSTASTEALSSAGRIAGAWVGAAAAGLLQMAIALFSLFFLFRDRAAVLRLLRSLMPMSDGEVDYFFEQIRSMTHATIYGTLLVSGIQGALGGLMFLLLGIPGPLLWGFVMAVLSVIPSAGAFLVWLPVAVVLAVQGEMVKASILGLWGLLAVSTIDNVLYPLLVGKEVRLHTLPVFLALLGGLAVFGAAGVVLGPIILVATISLLNIVAARFRKPPPVRV